MKFILKDKEKKSTPEITLWLEVGMDGKIILEGEDNNGKRKSIMIFSDGRFRRYTSAQLEGLETDTNGRIERGI